LIDWVVVVVVVVAVVIAVFHERVFVKTYC
jgi:hypothetical protein